MESLSEPNFMQSRASIPRDSYSNKNVLDKISVSKTSQVNLDKEPNFHDYYGNWLSLKKAIA